MPVSGPQARRRVAESSIPSGTIEADDECLDDGPQPRRNLDDLLVHADPKRAGETLVRLVEREHLPTHLLLGVSAAEHSIAYSRRQLAEATAWEAVSRSVDFDQSYPVDLPADESVEQACSASLGDSDK